MAQEYGNLLKIKGIPRKLAKGVFNIRGTHGIFSLHMRKRTQKLANSGEGNFEEEVRNRLSDLETRISRLESESLGLCVLPQEPPLAKQGMGRKRRIEVAEVLKRRDQLVSWFESVWPFLSIALRKAKNSRDANAAMVEAKTRKPFIEEQPPFERNPQKHEAALWEFLQSGRFHENPRNLAAAMAGLPELSWKRSFDICSRHPCKQIAAEQSWRDYLRRKFPERLRELCRAKTVYEVRTILKKLRSHDPTCEFLKKHPDAVFRLFNPEMSSD